MNNIWIFIFIICIVSMLITFVVISILSIKNWNSTRNSSVDANVTTCTAALDQLIDISDLGCCYVGNTATSSKYVPSLNMVVNSYQPSIYYLNVCQGYCSDADCSIESEKIQYNNCIELTKPVNCIGNSNAVAVVGKTYYYGVNAGKSTCMVEGTCMSI